MNFYSWHIGDYKSHTDHLTLEEDAVYRRLLDFYYDTEAPIPKETQPVIRRLRLIDYEEITGRILGEFFTLKSDGWHNFRADQEIISYHGKIEAARANGRKGGRPKKNNVLQALETQPFNSANPDITQMKAIQEPRTNNQEPIVIAEKKKRVRKVFKIPTVKEVSDYAQTIGYSIDAEKFCNHYEMRGWMINRTPMKSWEAAVRTWKSNQSNFGTPMNSSSNTNFVKEV